MPKKKSKQTPVPEVIITPNPTRAYDAITLALRKWFMRERDAAFEAARQRLKSPGPFAEENALHDFARAQACNTFVGDLTYGDNPLIDDGFVELRTPEEHEHKLAAQKAAKGRAKPSSKPSKPPSKPPRKPNKAAR